MKKKQEVFSEYLCRLRKEKNLTQQQLAEQLNISRSSLCRYETGTRLPNLQILSQLAKYLGVDKHELIDKLYSSSEIKKPSPVSILTVDGNSSHNHELTKLLLKFLPKAEIKSFDSANKAKDYSKKTNIDIAFLYLNKADCTDLITLSENIKVKNNHTNIIFISDNEKYMPEAFSMHISGYILNPLSASKLKNELSNLRHPLAELDI